MYIGIDIGSTTVKIVVINEKNEICESKLARSNAQPIVITEKLYKSLNVKFRTIKGIGITGSGRHLKLDFLKTNFIRNEITAHVVGIINYMNLNQATIIEIGGQDSKKIEVDKKRLKSFRVNTVCAAGTGSFLEWQAQRLGLTINHFSDVALKSKNPIVLGGKCVVFIESSIIKAQQSGKLIDDIAMGICLSLANNYIGELGRINSSKPVIFQGGVASIPAMKKAFEDILNTQVKVPHHENIERMNVFMGAYGIAILSKKLKNQNIYKNTKNFDSLKCKNCIEEICRNCFS